MTFKDITEGIVLSTIPYKDNTQLVHIFTAAHGKQTFRCPLSRSRKNAQLRTAMAPLTMIELTCERNRQGSAAMQQLRDIRVILSPYELSMTHPGITAQCIYLAELLDKTIRQVEPDPMLWNFIHQGIELLTSLPTGHANFHLVFTLRLCQILGFHIDDQNYRPEMRFDISEGYFTDGPIDHPYYLTPESAAWFRQLLRTDFTHLDTLCLSHRQRNILLDMMLLFLRIHIPEMGEIKSVEVLKSLFY